MNWKDEQLQAIHRSGNLLVAAGAGSGKTAVLAERVARLVREGTDIDSMLIVTFTNAAADEMKKRIEKRLTEAVLENKEDSARLKDQIMRISRAQISTLHAFCTQILRRHFHEADVDPAFRVAEEAEIAVIKLDALDEMIESEYEKATEAFLGINQRLEGGEDALPEFIERIRTFIFSQPEPFEWLEKSADAYAMEPSELEESEAVRTLVFSVKEKGINAQQLMSRARALVSDSAPEMAKVRSVLELELESIQAFNSVKTTYSGIFGGFSKIQFGTLRWPKDCDSSDCEEVKKLREEAKELVKQIRAEMTDELAAECIKQNEFHPYMVEIVRLVKEFDRIYTRLKNEKGVIDFTDIEHKALKALSKPEIMEEYQNKFEYIFVDEYQDINRVQDRLLSCVRKKDNFFCVGDVKQSIYQFRLAEPKLFLELYDKYLVCGGTNVDLTSNFRCALSVLDAVNGLFGRIMSKRLGDIDYKESSALKPGRQDTPEGTVELHIIKKETGLQEQSEEDEPEQIPDEQFQEREQLESAELEALLAVQCIRKRLHKECVLKGGTRPLGYGDFAVLLRATRSVAGAWLRLFALEGIPAYADMTGGYFEVLEIQLFINLLRIISNRHQDIPLLSILRSPIGGFETGELIEIRAGFEGKSYQECFFKAAQAESALGEKVRSFLKKLDRWRDESLFYQTEEFISRLITETGFYHFVAALPGGVQRQANLDSLIERARSFEQGAARGLNEFLKFVDQLKSSSSDMGAAATHDAMDVVKILSVHKSKGLEFPVVIFAGLGRPFNLQIKREQINMHRKLGLGVCYVDPKTRVRKETLFHKAIIDRSWNELISEELRVLYVGMTRAQNELIMIASTSGLDNKIRKLEGRLMPSQLASGKCYLDWLIPAMLDQADGNVLRREAGCAEPTGKQNVSVYVHTCDELGLPSGQTISQHMFECWEKESVQADYRFVKERFCWKYPYASDSELPSKLPASSLGGPHIQLAKEPAFRRAAQASAADYGTAMHLILQHLSLTTTDSGVQGELQKLFESGLATQQQMELIDLSAIRNFWDSVLGQRIRSSKRVERELPFSAEVPANMLLDTDSSQNILVQGVVDCCFIENGQWVLLDYKTDRVDNGDYQTAAKNHSRQLEIYAYALEKLSRVKVTEKYIVFLRAGTAIQI